MHGRGLDFIKPVSVSRNTVDNLIKYSPIYHSFKKFADTRNNTYATVFFTSNQNKKLRELNKNIGRVEDVNTKYYLHEIVIIFCQQYGPTTYKAGNSLPFSMQ